MIDSILQALNFEFFVRALIFGIMISIIFAVLGVFIVAKKEANISHTISNFALFGISIGLLAGINIDISIISSCILGIVLIYILKNSKLISNDSIMEIGAQAFMALAVIIISQIKGYQANISNYLFGDILAISNIDIYFGIGIGIITLIFFIHFRKKLMQTLFSEDLAISIGTNTNSINLLYISVLAVSISLGMKILGALLISAFLIIPPNISKLISRNFKTMFINSIIIGIFCTLIGLFGSYILDFPSGATIIATMTIALFLTILIKKLFRI